MTKIQSEDQLLRNIYIRISANPRASNMTKPTPNVTQPPPAVSGRLSVPSDMSVGVGVTVGAVVEVGVGLAGVVGVGVGVVVGTAD